MSQFGPHLHSPFGPHLHISNSTGKNSAFTQPIYQNNNSSPEVTIINYSPNYNLISIMLAPQHHDTRIIDRIQFFSCIKTSGLVFQDQRQQNTSETTKNRFHQEYEPPATTREAKNSFSPPISFDESVVAAHLATNDFFSARLLFYSNCQFFNPLNHLHKLMSMHS